MLQSFVHSADKELIFRSQEHRERWPFHVKVARDLTYILQYLTYISQMLLWKYFVKFPHWRTTRFATLCMQALPSQHNRNGYCLHPSHPATQKAKTNAALAGFPLAAGPPAHD